MIVELAKQVAVQIFVMLEARLYGSLVKLLGSTMLIRGSLDYAICF
jgi:hypothetical protein